MYCKHCGAALPENIRFCSGCGAQIAQVPDSHHHEGGGHVGYSDNIHDPAFARFIKSNIRWSVVFLSVLAVAAVVGFFIFGEEIGLGIGAMFLLSALFTIITARKGSKTWDGVVVDKTAERKRETRRQSTGSGKFQQYDTSYTEYSVLIKDERGKIHSITVRNDDTRYNYFQVGDRVRHHGGLNSYEKYDKSRDSIIFCNACTKLCDINDDICSRCKCPLLK